MHFLQVSLLCRNSKVIPISLAMIMLSIKFSKQILHPTLVATANIPVQL